MKRSRKCLKTIQVAVDKENLVGREPIGLKTDMVFDKKDVSEKRSEKPKANDLLSVKNNINKPKNERNINKSLTNHTATNQNNNGDQPLSLIEDLTNDGPPSEKYWEHLAESRRIALDSALKENIDLHNKMTELEYENRTLKDMLQEARSLVEVLTGMLNEEESNENQASEDEDDVDEPSEH